MTQFDWKNPEYVPIFRRRVELLAEIRRDPKLLADLRVHYKQHPAQFIDDFGTTFDPRLQRRGLPAVIPFILFPRQREWIVWAMERWQSGEPGATVKARDAGVSWLAMALSCTLCLFYRDMAIGFGSRKLELVDALGNPDSLFWKGRTFVELLPPEFTGGWTKANAPEKRIKFPTTGSVIVGEGGDDIGRGGRSGLYFVDEAAALERPELAEASLSQTTDCRMDISTPRGLGNPFARKVHEWPEDRVFRFSWRDDPRKDDAWYAKQVSQLDPVTVAQEIDMDFAASVEGVLIPSAWVQAAVDAHVKLGIAPTGERRGALDVADEGRDLNAFAVSHGVLLEHVEEWSGKESDIFGTVVRAFGLADEHRTGGFRYDADGLGAGVRGDARVINEQRNATVLDVNEQARRTLAVDPFRGSETPFDPEGEDVKGRKNKDYFMNRKAQAWFALRKRFQITYRAVTDAAYEYDPDSIVSIDGRMDPKTRNKLVGELSQPTYSLSIAGKIVVDKAPDGTRSPNLADAVMIVFSTTARPPMRIADDALQAFA